MTDVGYMISSLAPANEASALGMSEDSTVLKAVRESINTALDDELKEREETHVRYAGVKGATRVHSEDIEISDVGGRKSRLN
jgi:hypothetical protein